MIAPARIPAHYDEWNKRHGAPFGRQFPGMRRVLPLLPRSVASALIGPFGIQRNSTTRRFEYPWAFHAVPLARGQRIVEIGGGLSGFQFALARKGCDVTNIDPGLEAKGVGWKCDQESIAWMNRQYTTSVQLLNTTIERAQLSPNSYDRIYSISVIEHLPHDDIEEMVRYAFTSLKPGGHFVLTVDLFLDIAPFTSAITNKYGTNINIRQLIDRSGMVLTQGDRDELFGYSEFDPDRIQRNLSSYLIGSYPVLVQCLVLSKPSGSHPIGQGLS